MSVVDALVRHFSPPPPAAPTAEGRALAARAPRPERLAALQALLEAGHLDGAIALLALNDEVLRDWLLRATWGHTAHRLVWLHHLLGHAALPPDLYEALCELVALTAPDPAALPPDAPRRVALGHLKHRIETSLHRYRRDAPALPPPQTRDLPGRMADALQAGQAPEVFWTAQLADQAHRAVAGSLALLSPWHATPARLQERFAEISAVRTLDLRWRADWNAISADASPENLVAVDRAQRQALSQTAAGVLAREARQFRRHALALAHACLPSPTPSSR